MDLKCSVNSLANLKKMSVNCFQPPKLNTSSSVKHRACTSSSRIQNCSSRHCRCFLHRTPCTIEGLSWAHPPPDTGTCKGCWGLLQRVSKGRVSLCWKRISRTQQIIVVLSRNQFLRCVGVEAETPLARRLSGRSWRLLSNTIQDSWLVVAIGWVSVARLFTIVNKI